MVHRPGPPILGLLFLFVAVSGMGWAGSIDTAPAVDPAPAPVVERPAAQPAGARATHLAELARRLPPSE